MYDRLTQARNASPDRHEQHPHSHITVQSSQQLIKRRHLLKSH